MKKALLLSFCFLFCAFLAHSQDSTPYSITGKVVDADNGDPLEYATITFKLKGKSNIIGGITDAKGEFEIIVPEGKYNITVEYLAYKTITFKSQQITNDVHYGSIELSEDTELLEGIEIVGEKKTIEIKPNKIVFNVSKDIGAESNSVSEILNNVPSVTVENDVPTIRGKIATVMINGKTSSLSKTDALKSLPAGSVERIEVISSPGAQFNASFNSIINIILKKGKDEGLNASVTGLFGYKDIFGGLLTLNHKSKKVNFFTNTSFSHKNRIRTSDAENEYFSSGSTTSYLNEGSKSSSKNSNLITTIGADFYLSKKSTLTTYINYSNLNHKGKTNTNSSILDALQTETSFNERENLSDFDDEIIEFVADFEHQFAKEGRSLSTSVIYTNDIEKSSNDITNTDINYTDESFTQKNKLLNTEFNIKYTTPITTKTSLLVGYNADIGKIPFRNSTPERNIDYAEDVHAAFAEYAYENDKFYADIGLRSEFSKTSIDYLDLNITQKRNLDKLFPSAYLAYNISDNKTINASFNKGIYRVSYEQLQPFEERFSETSFYVGNENLKPTYIDSYGLDYSYLGEKTTFITKLFYDKYNDWWQDVTYETGEQIDGVNKLISTPQNVGSVDYYGVDLTAIYKVNNQLNFTFGSTLYNFDQHGIFETINTVGQPIHIDYNYKNFNGNFKLLTQVKLPKNLKFQTSIFHYLKSKGPVSLRKKYTYATLAASKDLFEKKATLSLSANDVFNSKVTKRDRFDTNYFSSSIIRNQPDVVLSFTYRFNQSKNNRKINLDKKDRNPNF